MSFLGAAGGLDPIVVRVIGDISGLQSGVAKAQGEFTKLGAAGEATSVRLQRSFTTAATAIGAALTGIGVVGIEAAGKLEQAHSKLTTVIENTGHAYEEYASRIT